MRILDFIFKKQKNKRISDYSLVLSHEKTLSDSLNNYIDDLEGILQESDLNKILLMNGKIVNEISNINLRKYSKESQRLDHIIDLIADLSILSKDECSSQNDDIFFKVYKDEAKSLVAVFLNLSEFLPEDRNTPTLYLSFGKRLNMRSRMYLEYEGYSNNLIINDFFSEVERRGHGGIMLNALLEIIPKLNQRIEEHNKQFYSEIKHRYTFEEFENSLSYKKQIKIIRGRLVPSRGLTVEDLRRFYGRYGFITDGKLYKEV